MLQKIVPLLLLSLLYVTCSTDIQVAAPAESGTEWLKTFQGEEVIVVTKGTVAVDTVDFLKRHIPGARWSARFDYDPDVSSNYLILDFSEERSGTPLEPIIREMFSGIPRSGTLQVNHNRIRLGYFSAPTYMDWISHWEKDLKAYGQFIENSDIEETRGPWYADPSKAYLKETRDKRTEETFLTAVDYNSGEERPLVRFSLVEGQQGQTLPWTVRFEDLTGRLEWISGLVSYDRRPGENLSGFYGAMEEGRLEFSGRSERSYSSESLSLIQVDLEFGNELIMTLVKGRGLRRAYPHDNGTLRITGEERGFLVSGFDLAGNAIPLFLLAVDYRADRVSIETYRQIRNLELPLVFNETDRSTGTGRVYSFSGLRANYTERLELPVSDIQTLRIGPVGKDRGFADLNDGLFFSFGEQDEPEIELGENRLLLFSNNLPFGDLSYVSRYISFYPPLNILSVDSDLILSEEGKTEYYLEVETSPMEPGVNYQVTLQPHPTLFGQGYVWEFRGR